MKKILYVASRISHITNFHMPYINYFKNKGYVVHILSEGNGDLNVDKIYDVIFEKKITSLKNLKTIKLIKTILEKEKYDLIITNTTLASFIVRIAKQNSNVKNYGKLINIVHGYLFSKNTNLIKKILYVFAEKLCVSSTDLLITMNKEDYELAKKYCLCKKEIKNINGMGIPKPPIFDTSTKEKIRNDFNITNSDILMTYAGELSKRKNQIFLIHLMPELIKNIPNLKLILAGNGELYNYYKSEILRLNLESHIILSGHLTNIKELIFSSDIIISSSLSEGLPFNIMEAMSLGIPIVASNVKGHNDLIIDGFNGYLFELNDSKKNSLNEENSTLINKLLFIINNKNIDNLKKNELDSIKNYMLDNIFKYNIKLLDI